jgi:hypothetical protein
MIDNNKLVVGVDLVATRRATTRVAPTQNDSGQAGMTERGKYEQEIEEKISF